MRRQRKYVSNKTKISEKKELKKVEISNLPDREFKVMTIKMHNELRRRMDKHSVEFNKELEIQRRTKES